MFKRMGALLTLTVIAAVIFVTTQTAVAAPVKPVVFLLPHQDDEMFLAGAIKASLDLGNNVYVIMVTDGAASEARAMLNGSEDNKKPYFCRFHHATHDPKKEGYQRLNKETFIRARNQEFLFSMMKLGVSPGHVFFANPGGSAGSRRVIYHDGKLTRKQAKKIITRYYAHLGDGVYSTIRGNGGHLDHLALYQALANFKGISEKYFYSELVGEGKEIPLTPEEQKAKSSALEPYFEWDPPRKKFAIGAHSVEHLLDTWKNNPSEYLIK